MQVQILPPIPPEKQAFALARASRSSDRIHESLKWVYAHDEQKFLDSYYFQYGHASIADLGHVAIALEELSDLAAQDVWFESLIDGQGQSTRYQDFSRVRVIDPLAGLLFTSDMATTQRVGQFKQLFNQTIGQLMSAYQQILELETKVLAEQNPKPADMPEEQYARTIRARSFDVARYCLPMGIPTNVDIVVSIRTLERLINRLLVSDYPEIRMLGRNLWAACKRPPMSRAAFGIAEKVNGEYQQGGSGYLPTDTSPVVPTLAKHIAQNEYLRGVRERAKKLAYGLNFRAGSVPTLSHPHVGEVGLHWPGDPADEILATLLWQQGTHGYDAYRGPDDRPYLTERDLAEVLGHPGPHDEPLRELRAGLPYQFEIHMDYGGWRDLHRHRRCEKFWKGIQLVGEFQVPPHPAGGEAIKTLISDAYTAAYNQVTQMADLGFEQEARYALPFCHTVRTLFKMDLGEVLYLTRLRTGVKGHDAYRWIAWAMAELVRQQHPGLAPYIQTTHPDVREPLIR